MNLDKRYIPIYVFLGVTLLVFLTFIPSLVNEVDSNFLMEFFSALDTATAIALAVLAYLGYREYVKSEDVIPMTFFCCEQCEERETFLKLLRKNCIRSEILGILGMVQKNPKERFEIAYLKEEAFLDSIQAIQQGKDSKLVIKITSKELEQFVNWEKL